MIRYERERERTHYPRTKAAQQFPLNLENINRERLVASPFSTILAVLTMCAVYYSSIYPPDTLLALGDATQPNEFGFFCAPGYEIVALRASCEKGRIYPRTFYVCFIYFFTKQKILAHCSTTEDTFIFVFGNKR